MWMEESDTTRKKNSTKTSKAVYSRISNWLKIFEFLFICGTAKDFLRVGTPSIKLLEVPQRGSREKWKFHLLLDNHLTYLREREEEEEEECGAKWKSN